MADHILTHSAAEAAYLRHAAHPHPCHPAVRHPHPVKQPRPPPRHRLHRRPAIAPPDHFAATLAALYENPAWARQLTGAAHRLLAEKVSPDAIASGFAAMLGQTLPAKTERQPGFGQSHMISG